MKGSQIAIACLERHAVEELFAYPGGQAIDLHQALYDSKIRVVLPRHEQGGAFAAGGYARATGKVGVCMATSGPGATNLLSGIADAYLDSVPTIFITGQVPAHMIGKNVFQEIDMIGMTRPIVKHSYLVLDARELPQVMNEAFYLAQSGRPGPVVVDIPKNVQQQIVPDNEIDFDAPLSFVPTACCCPDDTFADDIENVRQLLRRCERPCVYVGGGIISSGSSAELRKFVESYHLPVTTTLMGLGAIPMDHELSLGMPGMHGTVYANYAINEADLVIALGARFDDRVIGTPKTFAAGATIVHVEIDATEINKNIRADHGILADVSEVLRALNKDPFRCSCDAWHERIDEWKKEFPASYRVKPERIQPQFVVETLSRLTHHEAVIVPGVGQHQMWAAQYYNYQYPRQFLSSSGLGAMGFGLPAAMGAKLACPDKTVINIDGDGSFQMNIQELGTLKVEDIAVKMVILNNQHLGMVAQWEDRFYQSRRGNTVLGRCRGSRGDMKGECGSCDGTRCVGEPYPNFVKIAGGYEIPGRAVFCREELEDAIREMLETDGPYLLDVYTGYDEHVLPMIPPGKDFRSIIYER